MYEKDTLSALDAITEAQRIAFAPMLFQTALCLRNSGVLAWLDKQGKEGASLEEITEHSTLGSYDVSGNDSNLLIVFYVQIMPDDFVMQLHRF